MAACAEAMAHYFHIWTDTSGRSHITGMPVQTRPDAGYGAGIPEVETTELTKATGVQFLCFKRGWVSERHHTPARQFAVVVEGEIEVATASNSVRAGPGAAFYVEDTWGEGHSTRTIGDTDALLLMVHSDAPEFREALRRVLPDDAAPLQDPSGQT
jgi:quercetin dioxygenase-like cupin family protein